MSKGNVENLDINNTLTLTLTLIFTITPHPHDRINSYRPWGRRDWNSLLTTYNSWKNKITYSADIFLILNFPFKVFLSIFSFHMFLFFRRSALVYIFDIFLSTFSFSVFLVYRILLSIFLCFFSTFSYSTFFFLRFPSIPSGPACSRPVQLKPNWQKSGKTTQTGYDLIS